MTQQMENDEDTGLKSLGSLKICGTESKDHSWISRRYGDRVERGLYLEYLLDQKMREEGFNVDWFPFNHERADFDLKEMESQIEAKNLKGDYTVGLSWLRQHAVSRFKRNTKHKVLVVPEKKWTKEADEFLMKKKIHVIEVGKKLGSWKRELRAMNRFWAMLREILGLQHEKREKTDPEVKKERYCPDCQAKLIEVKKGLDPETNDAVSLYPKSIAEPGLKKVYNEYRYACPQCKKEWIYNSLWRWFEEVPEDANFQYSFEKGYWNGITYSLFKRMQKRREVEGKNDDSTKPLDN